MNRLLTVVLMIFIAFTVLSSNLNGNGLGVKNSADVDALINEIRNLKVSLSDQEKKELENLCSIPEMVEQLHKSAGNFHQVDVKEISFEILNKRYLTFLDSRKDLKENSRS